MSGPRPLRRTDKAVSEERARETLLAGFSGRLGTVGADGWPYVVPFLCVWMDQTKSPNAIPPEPQ